MLETPFGYRSSVTADATVATEADVPFSTFLGGATNGGKLDGSSLDDAATAMGGFDVISRVTFTESATGAYSVFNIIGDLWDSPTYEDAVLSGPFTLADGDAVGLTTQEWFDFAKPPVIETWLTGTASIASAGTLSQTFTVPQGYSARVLAQFTPTGAAASTTIISDFDRMGSLVAITARSTESYSHSATTQRQEILGNQYEPGEYQVSITCDNVGLSAIRFKIKYTRD